MVARRWEWILTLDLHPLPPPAAVIRAQMDIDLRGCVVILGMSWPAAAAAPMPTRVVSS
jgi:hypothetical protein